MGKRDYKHLRPVPAQGDNNSSMMEKLAQGILPEAISKDNFNAAIKELCNVLYVARDNCKNPNAVFNAKMSIDSWFDPSTATMQNFPDDRHRITISEVLDHQFGIYSTMITKLEAVAYEEFQEPYDVFEEMIIRNCDGLSYTDMFIQILAWEIIKPYGQKLELINLGVMAANKKEEL